MPRYIAAKMIVIGDVDTLVFAGDNTRRYTTDHEQAIEIPNKAWLSLVEDGWFILDMQFKPVVGIEVMPIFAKGCDVEIADMMSDIGKIGRVIDIDLSENPVSYEIAVKPKDINASSGWHYHREQFGVLVAGMRKF